MMQTGESPLGFAAQDGRKDIVQLLLDHHANVDLPTDVRHSNTMYTIHIDTCAPVAIHS